MSDYRLEIPANIWNHQNAEGLARLTRLLTELQITGFTVTREPQPKPEPEVRIVEKVMKIYACLMRKKDGSLCDYTTSSLGGLKTHRRVHEK